MAEAVLFLSSFSPLFVVFGLLDSFGAGVPSYACYAVAACSALFLLVSLRLWGTLNVTRVKVTRARQRDADAIAYVATYIVPFATLGTDSWKSRSALLLFLVLVAVLYVRAHLFYVNPLLSLIGYRLFEAETESGRVMLVISKRDYIRGNSEIDVRTLSDYIFLQGNDTAAPPQPDRRLQRVSVGR
jgi:hypothetical protein